MKENVSKIEYVRSISHRIKEKVKDPSGIEVVSVAIFGSVARQENGVDSDIDLLVVAEGVAKKRIERIPDMIRIERELDLGFPLDILLACFQHQLKSYQIGMNTDFVHLTEQL